MISRCRAAIAALCLVASTLAPALADAQSTVPTPDGTHVPVAPSGYVGPGGTLTATSPTNPMPVAPQGSQTTSGAVSIAPTGSSQYALFYTWGFGNDGVTPITGPSTCSYFKPSPGNAYVIAGNNATANQWVFVMDVAVNSGNWPSNGTLYPISDPADLGTLIFSFLEANAGPWSWTLGTDVFPAGFNNAILVCYSSTGPVNFTRVTTAGSNTLVGAPE